MLTISRFALVGGLGFVCDAACFAFLLKQMNLSIELSRVYAFLVAMTVTWLGNRYITFAQANREGMLTQWLKHALTAVLSFTFNFALFNLLLLMSIAVPVAFVAGVLLGMLTNFYSSKHFVFVVSANEGAKDLWKKP